MKKSIFFVLIIIIFNKNYTQQIREVRSFHENGKENTIVYKDSDLRVIKTESFDNKDKKISSYEIDPNTQKYNGTFFNTVNKGQYRQGVLNCDNCTLNTGQNTQIKGNFKNGKPTGKIDFYSVKEKVNLQYNATTSYLLSMDHGQRINYSTYVGTGIYDIEYKMSINYNDSGKIDGEVMIDKTTKLYFKDGNMLGFVVKNEQNLNFSKDSVFKENKIWKVDNQFVKNSGWLSKLDWNEFNQPWNFNFESGDGYYDDYRIFFGSEFSITERKFINDYYRPTISYDEIDENIVFIKNRKSTLTNNGLYIKGKQKNEKMLRHLIKTIYSVTSNNKFLINDLVDIRYNDDEYKDRFIKLSFNSIFDYTDSILKNHSNISEVFIMADTTYPGENENDWNNKNANQKINYINFLKNYDTYTAKYRKDRAIIEKNLNHRLSNFNQKFSSLKSNNEQELRNFQKVFPNKFNDYNLPWWKIVKSYEKDGFKLERFKKDNKYFFLNFYKDFYIHADEKAILKLCKLSDADFEKWLNTFEKSFSTDWLIPQEWKINLEKRKNMFYERAKNIVYINNEISIALSSLFPREMQLHPNANKINSYEKIGFKKGYSNSKYYFGISYWKREFIYANYEAVDYLCKLSNDEFKLWLDEFEKALSCEYIYYSNKWANKIIPALVSSNKIKYSSEKIYPNYFPELVEKIKIFQKSNHIKIEKILIYNFGSLPIYLIELKKPDGYSELLSRLKLAKEKKFRNKAFLAMLENDNTIFTSINIFDLN
tara:strand:- start:1300 stop:3594 length:2295 start_codon:yes stop_codon:yes gene_type:complete